MAFCKPIIYLSFLEGGKRGTEKYSELNQFKNDQRIWPEKGKKNLAINPIVYITTLCSI